MYSAARRTPAESVLTTINPKSGGGNVGSNRGSELSVYFSVRGFADVSLIFASPL